ncbi:hypothetical protein [Streptomyces sp. NPDC048442]|uniref:hypothetical protein n=1 Tax=Streptomyces sp. NPDC048442 TaxID=3154823 RepID=UPI0034364B80
MTLTADQALDNAARLLELAELNPNPALMERYDAVACSWLAMASLLLEKERV